MRDQCFKMIQSSQEEAFSRQDVDTSANDKAATSSRVCWSSLKNNPRIVRVSRAFGGKDRHSKVRTIRGLRDRRIRLSVPTAIQLYDLQDKLGFNQPSKVVDWLLTAAQHEIDKLPPLEMLQGNLIQCPPYVVNSHMMSTSAQAYSGHAINADDHELLPRDKAHQLASSSSLAIIDIFNSKSLDVLMQSKEKEALKEPGLVKGSNNSNSAIHYSPYYHLETAINACSSHTQSEVLHGYHPVAVFSSYMAPNMEPKQYGHHIMASSASANASLRTSLPAGIPTLTIQQQDRNASKHQPQTHYATYIADS